MHRYAIIIILLAAAATGFAQSRATVLDGVYTAAQAERGNAAYHAACVGCHEGQDADGPELAGRVFLDRWREDSLDPLFTFIRTRMPGHLPGSLADSAYVDITAYVLQINGFPAGKTELTAGVVGSIELTGPEGPQPLPNLTIVRTVGCLSQGPDHAWTLLNAARLAPVRERIVEGATPEELKRSAAQPLGTQAFPLLGVKEPSASYAGHKVQITGVLTRQKTLDRINVMSLQSVAARCGP